MAVVEFLPALLARRVQVRAVGHDDVVAAIGRGVKGWLVFAHEEDGDARGQAAEGGRWDQGGVGGWEGPDCVQVWMRVCGGDVMPCS